MKDPFIHVVFFWLKEPQNADHRKEFESSIHRFLTHSQFASSWHVGTAAGTNRTVVDNSYTYSLVVTFSSSSMHDKYQNEPAHLLFVEESAHLWERVQVYDTHSL